MRNKSEFFPFTSLSFNLDPELSFSAMDPELRILDLEFLRAFSSLQSLTGGKTDPLHFAHGRKPGPRKRKELLSFLGALQGHS